MSKVSFSPDEQRDFVRDGVIIRRGFVEPDLCSTARNLVDEWYRTAFDIAELERYNQVTFAPPLGSHPSLLRVFNASGLRELCVSLVRPYDIQDVSKVQIQIRVPEGTVPVAQREKSMHVDGVAVPHLDAMELRTFTLLVGIPLSEVVSVDGGALRYVPGGHEVMAKWFRGGWVPGTREQVPPTVDAMPGTPFLGKPGDVIVMHHLVPHAVGANRTAAPRVMLYFRIRHERHEENVLAALRDPWVEFPALHGLIP